MIVTVVMLFICAGWVQVQGQEESLAGLWEFDDPDSLTLATVGPELVLVGIDSAVAGPVEGDGAVYLSYEGYYEVDNPIDTLVSEYSFVFDFRIDELAWQCFYQTDIANTNEGDCWIDDLGNIGVWASPVDGYKPADVKLGHWHRLVVTVSQEDSLGLVNYYLDGIPFFKSDAKELHARFILRERILLITDGDGWDGPINIAQIRLYNKALNDNEVMAIGGYDSFTGIWNFDDPDNLPKAIFGTDLEFVGSIDTTAGAFENDGAVQADVGSHMKATHGIDPAVSEGAKVNEFTLVMDVMIPESDKLHFLYQTDPTNQNNGDWAIKPTGEIGIDATGYTDSLKMKVGEWYRLAIAVKNGERYDYYADGKLVLNGTPGAVDGQFSLESTVLLFADNDGEDNPLSVGKIVIHKKALTNEEIADLGGFAHVESVGLVGHWTFDNVENQLEATVGNDLQLIGTHLPAEGPIFGNLATNIGEGSHYRVAHGIDPLASPGDNVNIYTLVYDFVQKSDSYWTALLQTDTSNTAEGQFYTSWYGVIWTPAVETAADVLPLDVWNRVALAVYNGQIFEIYLNGELVLSGPGQTIDGPFSLIPEILFCADPSGYDDITDVSEIMLFDEYLSAEEILALGGPPVGVADNPNNVIRNYELGQNYPNPFNPSTKIKFSIKKAGQTTLKVYDVLGREVAVLVNKKMVPGTYDVEFYDAQIATGLYFYQIQSGDFVATKKMLLIK